MRLKSVVFPAPLGPINAIFAPRGTSKEMFSETVSPPKRFTTPASFRMASSGMRASRRCPAAGPPVAGRKPVGECARDDAFRPYHHHQHDGDAEHDIAPRPADTQEFRDEREEQAAHQRPPGRLRPTDKDEEQHV